MNPFKTKRVERAFTLIELLIVVAIIAILAAIAVPNFLEAQTRSKVSRTKADIRTQGIALDSYFIDWNKYTKDSDSSLDMVGNSQLSMGDRANGVLQLTTPIAYMSSMLTDPFGGQILAVGGGGGAMGYRIASGSWSYTSPGNSDNQKSYEIFQQMGPRPCYAVIGVGPDQNRCRMGYKCFPFEPNTDAAEGPVGTDMNASKKYPNCWTSYDPSNGTVSVGDVYLFGGSYREGRFMLDGMTIGAQNSPGGDCW